jgi:2,5-diketo-D-gluconate reductase B
MKGHYMHIPPLGLGTFRLQGQQVIESVSNGLAAGYRHIDTAQIYGNEADIGTAIAECGIARSELFVTTKIWTDNMAAGKLICSLEESLQKLGLEQVDLTLLHWPSPGNAIPVAESMNALMEARERGLTKLIGISNFTIAQMREAAAAVGATSIATNQVEIHPFLQNRKLIDAAREMGLHLTAYMPLAYGKVMQDPVMLDIAARHGATPAQVALAWLLQQGHAVIPSSTKSANLQSNLKALSLRLTEDDIARIRALDSNMRIANPDFAPDWDA